MAVFDACVDFTLRPENEGAYVDNPADPGGPTNFGITLDGLSAWRGCSCTAEDVRLLSLSEAREIYQARYWAPMAGDHLPLGVDLMVFDFGVNTGPHSSIRMLQRIIGATEDGEIGPATLRRASCAGAVLRSRIAALAAAQEAFYAALHNPVFSKGWLARTRRRQIAAMTMAAPTSIPAAAARAKQTTFS